MKSISRNWNDGKGRERPWPGEREGPHFFFRSSGPSRPISVLYLLSHRKIVTKSLKQDRPPNYNRPPAAAVRAREDRAQGGVLPAV